MKHNIILLTALSALLLTGCGNRVDNQESSKGTPDSSPKTQVSESKPESSLESSSQPDSSIVQTYALTYINTTKAEAHIWLNSSGKAATDIQNQEHPTFSANDKINFRVKNNEKTAVHLQIRNGDEFLVDKTLDADEEFTQQNVEIKGNIVFMLNPDTTKVTSFTYTFSAEDGLTGFVVKFDDKDIVSGATIDGGTPRIYLGNETGEAVDYEIKVGGVSKKKDSLEKDGIITFTDITIDGNITIEIKKSTPTEKTKYNVTYEKVTGFAIYLDSGEHTDMPTTGGTLEEGTYDYNFNCQSFTNGYHVKVTIGGKVIVDEDFAKTTSKKITLTINGDVEIVVTKIANQYSVSIADSLKNDDSFQAFLGDTELKDGATIEEGKYKFSAVYSSDNGTNLDINIKIGDHDPIHYLANNEGTEIDINIDGNILITVGKIDSFTVKLDSTIQDWLSQGMGLINFEDSDGKSHYIDNSGNKIAAGTYQFTFENYMGETDFHITIGNHEPINYTAGETISLTVDGEVNIGVGFINPKVMYTITIEDLMGGNGLTITRDSDNKELSGDDKVAEGDVISIKYTNSPNIGFNMHITIKNGDKTVLDQDVKQGETVEAKSIVVEGKIQIDIELA